MPLLKKKTFETSSIPEYLRDDEEIFLCEITNEIFRDYEEFCQRIILVSSMVWSCSMTGKSNLTYAEALASENAARKSIRDFPVELRTPVLFLTTKTSRGSFYELAEDVGSYVKDRFFVGEIVESTFNDKDWRESHVLQVIAPTEEQVLADAKKKNPPTRSSSPDRFSPPAHLYRYEIEQLDADDQDSSQTMIIEARNIRRKKGPFSKEKCRLFLKQYVELNEAGILAVKDSARQQFNLDKVTFDQIFDGPPPDFDTSKIKKLVNGMANGKKVRQETLAKFLKKQNYFGDENGKKLLEDMKKKEEEYKIKCEEVKQRKAEEKEREKQKRREDNIKISLGIKEWYKPKDDLELEDHQILPIGTQILCKIPPKYFGDTLMMLDFADQFQTILNTLDFFPSGLKFDLLERALSEKEPAGPFTDIVQMMLEALFNVQDEEKAENKESQAELNSEDFENMSLSEASHLATLALNWSKTFQGMPLNRLPIYPMTVSEILRLHLLSSGARVNDAAAKWRFQQRGGYQAEDDPGLELRIKYPHILKALALHNVNQLPMGDKLKILKCLMDQLLTYADVRDAIEEKMDKLKQTKIDLRALQAAERRREQDYASARLKIKKEVDNPDEREKELNKLSNQADKQRAEFETKSKELTNEISNLQNVCGSDRAYRRYIKTTALPGLFVENDEQFPGRCLDKVIEQQPELVNADRNTTILHVRKLLDESTTSNGSDKENDNKNAPKTPKKVNGTHNAVQKENNTEIARELTMCTAGDLPCPVHSSAGKPDWTFYHTEDSINDLISKLNRRGIREGELRSALEADKDVIEPRLEECQPWKLNSTIVQPEEENVDKRRRSKKLQSMYARYEDSNLGYPTDVDVNEVSHLTLIDNILEMEEKITTGCLGTLKVKDRKQWREHLLNRKYDLMDKTLVKKEDQVDKIKNETKTSRPNTPDSVYRDPGQYLGIKVEQESDESDNDSVQLTATEGQKTSVKALAIALVQISQALEHNHLKTPLGKADYSNRKKQECDILDRWEKSLLASTSFSQIFLHYCTLENCIMWNRSVLVQRCRVCRRGKDSQNMVMCTQCYKAHHIYCLKPKLICVPKTEWFCDICKPPEEKVKTPRKKRTRKLFTINDDETDTDSIKEESKEKKSRDKQTTRLEVCEECGSGGHVVCCDSCPKVYHLECVHPPMRRIPRGEWKCHNCKSKPNGTRKREDSSSDFEDTLPPSTQYYIQRRCAKNARSKIHGFIKTLRRTSVGSDSDEDYKDYKEEKKTKSKRGRPKQKSSEEEPKHKVRRVISSDDEEEESEDDVQIEKRIAKSRRGRPKLALKGSPKEETKPKVRSSDDEDEESEDDLPLHNAPLQELLQEVMRHKDSWPFTRAVLKSESEEKKTTKSRRGRPKQKSAKEEPKPKVPDYYDVIKKPMDFGKIKYKLNMGEYKCDADVMADIALVFENCNNYNTSDSPVFKCGIRLAKFVQKQCHDLKLNCPKDLMDLDEDDDVKVKEEVESDEEDQGPTKPKRARHR